MPADMGGTKEHPTSAIFIRSDRLRKVLHVLCLDVEAIEQALLGIAPSKDPAEKTETPKPPFLEDIKDRFENHIGRVENIQSTVSRIKTSLINAPPKIEGSGEAKMAV